MVYLHSIGFEEDLVSELVVCSHIEKGRVFLYVEPRFHEFGNGKWAGYARTPLLRGDVDD